VLPQPHRLLQTEAGHRVVVTSKVRLRVAYEVQVGHAAAWQATGAQFTLSSPAGRRALRRGRHL